LNALRVLSGIGLGGMLVSLFFLPEILYGLPRISDPDEDRRSGGNIPGSSDISKNHAFHLESQYLQSIGRKADHCMEKCQPYLNPGLNLPNFAVMIDVPVHHLAYYFREEKKISFQEYRNIWRINHAKKLILEGKTSHMTLEAIGLMSGFSNRNSFRIYFEKMEGISPHVFSSGMNEEFLA